MNLDAADLAILEIDAQALDEELARSIVQALIDKVREQQEEIEALTKETESLRVDADGVQEKAEEREEELEGQLEEMRKKAKEAEHYLVTSKRELACALDRLEDIGSIGL